MSRELRIIEYFSSGEQSSWLDQIQKSDWGAGQYLCELLRDHRLKELCGESTKVLMLADAEQLVSLCILFPRSGAIGIWDSCWIMPKYLHAEKAIGAFTSLQAKPACMRNTAILSGRQ